MFKTNFPGHNTIWGSPTGPRGYGPAQKNAFVFGSTDVCEAFFSNLVRIKNKYRYRLTDLHLNHLRTAFSTIAPRLTKKSVPL